MRNAEDIKRIFDEAAVETNPSKDEKILENITAAYKQTNKAQTEKIGLNIWRTIMKSPITKLAAAAVIIIAVIFGIKQLGGSLDMSNSAFAEVVKQIQKAKTISWTSTYKIEGQEPVTSRTMVKEPYYMRVELSDGRIWLLDHLQAKTLVLDPAKKIAEISSTAEQSLDIYDAFKNFRNLEDFSVERIGTQVINEKSSNVFELTHKKDKHKTTVYADIETNLPFRIKTRLLLHTGENETNDKSQEITIITTNIVFDEEMDASLFSMEIPEGYESGKIDGPIERSDKFAARVQSAANMDRILKACLIYSQENDEQWPNSLQSLKKYGLEDNVFKNPGQPENQKGYIYLKPDARIRPQQVVLYEAYDSWTDGINAGFADGHIEFVEKQEKFQQMLKENTK